MFLDHEFDIGYVPKNESENNQKYKKQEFPGIPVQG